MARYRGSSCKLCRRQGAKLFIKGERCLTEKCAFERREYPPGQHGQYLRRKISDYGVQLREKQKVRRIYGIMERQFSNYFKRAERETGITGENLLQLLELRLDNVVYRMGFAPSRKTARQLVLHGHFLVNDRKVNIPSYRLKPGDVIQVREKSRQLEVIHLALKTSDKGVIAPWLKVEKAKLRGEVLERPSREEIPTPVQEQLIVELYSR